MLLRILVLLLLVNAVKIPPQDVPVIIYKDMQASAVATPWLIVLKHDNRTIREHEECHIKQMNTYGSVWFFVLNAYYLYTYGYMSNPIEESCYALEKFYVPAKPKP